MVELAWASGLFDGEGTIFASTHLRYRPKYVKLTMAVVMTERVVVERFCAAIGIGHVTELRGRTTGNKRAYRWVLQGTEDVRRAFRLLAPYLSEPKRQQGVRALDKRLAYEIAHDKGQRTVCRNGHDYLKTRRQWPNGKNYCIRCLEGRR